MCLHVLALEVEGSKQKSWAAFFCKQAHIAHKKRDILLGGITLEQSFDPRPSTNFVMSPHYAMLREPELESSSLSQMQSNEGPGTVVLNFWPRSEVRCFAATMAYAFPMLLLNIWPRPQMSEGTV